MSVIAAVVDTIVVMASETEAMARRQWKQKRWCAAATETEVAAVEIQRKQIGGSIGGGRNWGSIWGGGVSGNGACR